MACRGSPARERSTVAETVGRAVTPMKKNSRVPGVIAIVNENPAWSDLDKEYGDEMWDLLRQGLADEGYTFESFKFFDDLGFLDQFDPHEWLVWNWGEEWAGEAWSEARVAEKLEARGFT